MEIKTLVYIGVACIIASIILYFYVYMGDLVDRINEFKKDLSFTREVKDELKMIDNNIKTELEKKQARDDLTIVKNELKLLNKSMEKANKNDKNELKLLKKSLEKTNKNELKLLKKSIENNNKLIKNKEEVFLVKGAGLFKEGDAPKICAGLFNAKVADKAQLQNSYNNGANWCNYGWTNNGDAYYPLQKDTANAICSGKKGLNGGEFEDNKYKLGVLCYGVKPDEIKYTSLEKIYQNSQMAEKDQMLLDDYRKKMARGEIKITAFNDKAWSQYSYKNDTLKINNTTVVSSQKDSAKNPQSIKIPTNKIEAFVTGHY